MTKSTADMAKLVQGQVRLPIVYDESVVDELSHLNDEEKARAKKNLKKIPPNQVWQVLGNDPEVQALWNIVESAVLALLAPDNQFTPGSPVNLITMQVARLYRSDWQIGSMMQVTRVHGDSWKPKGWDNALLGLLEFPDSAMWTEEQRLTLKFTQACLENTMTDELFAQALETWGPKLILRHIVWIAYVHSWAMIASAVNAPFVKGTVVPGGIPKELVDAQAAHLNAFYKKLQALWDAQPDMPGL